MEIAVVLFVLRLIAALLLLAMMGAIFWSLWRDYRVTISQLDSSRRVYGSLVAMQEVDESYVLTGQVYPLLPITSIGRAPTNTIAVQDNFASNEHALIALRRGQWWLEDRNSRNGTLLNGVMINRSVIITDGDVIGVGHIRLRLDLEK